MRFRQLLGFGAISSVTRKGLCWQLDLREGIDFSIWLFGFFEPETVACYSRIIKPGDTVLDVGANIGAHTLPIAKLVGENGQVLAFEPTDYAFSKLQQNVAGNNGFADRVKCLQFMLVDKVENSAPPPLYSSWPLAQEAGLHTAHLGKLMSTANAKATTLDAVLESLAPGRISCIKLDIDGFECQMLRGASEVLNRWHPMIVMELAPYVLEEQGSSVEDLLSILAGHGYSLFTLDGNTRLSTNPQEIRELIPEGASLNVLARTHKVDA